MTLTTLQKTQLNNSNKAMQSAQIGTLLGDMEAGAVGAIRKIEETVLFSQFTDGGAASGTYTLTAGTIPVGATVLSSAIKAITGFTGNVSATIIIGDGSDTDRYNTGTPSVFTTAAGGISAGAVSGVAYHTAEKSVVLTVAGSSDFTAISAGSVTVAVYYLL